LANVTAETSSASTAEGQRPGLVCLVWGAIATLLAILYTALLSPVAAVVSPFRDGHFVDLIGRFWSRLIIRTCGIRLDFRGLENIQELQSFVIVANHQSAFDIFALLGYLPRATRFVAKKELLKIPAFGFALTHAGHIVVDREQGGKEVRKAVKMARSGFAVVFFAEGHRFSDNRVHPFSEGAAWLALLTRLPCVPLAITGSAAVHPRGALLIRPGKTIRLSFGKPISTMGRRAAERTALTEELHHQVMDLFDRANRVD
jgi:1-acyl-sn-glycerol-3-phosphate acyltransferase